MDNYTVTFNVREQFTRTIEADSHAEAVRLVREHVNNHLANDLSGAKFSNFQAVLIEGAA